MRQLKEKMENRIIFKSKIKDKALINTIKESSLDDIILMHVDSLPIPATLQECHNQFIWIKKYANALMKKESEVSRELKELAKKIKEFVKSTKCKYIEELSNEQLELYDHYSGWFKSTEKVANIYKDMIIRMNYRLEYICLQYDKADLPLEKFASLCGINFKTAFLNINDRYALKKEDCGKGVSKHYMYLFDGIEDSREEEGWKYNKYGMPLFDLTLENFSLLLDRNKEAKQKVNDFLMHDMGMAEHAMVLKEDEDGNQILEKYYPPLKAIK